MFGFTQKLFGTKTDLKKIVHEGALILDVRTTTEFNSGHIQGAKNIPLDQLKGKIDELRKEQKTIITVCRSGARSGMAQVMLSEAGLKAYNGGSWNSLEQKL